MLKRTSTPSKNNICLLDSFENCSILMPSNEKAMWIQTDVIEKSSKSTNTPNYVDDIIIRGKNMNDKEFEKFVKGK